MYRIGACAYDEAELTAYAARWWRQLRDYHGADEARSRAVLWLADRCAETRTGLPLGNARWENGVGNPEPLRRHEEAFRAVVNDCVRAVRRLEARDPSSAGEAVEAVRSAFAAIRALDAPKPLVEDPFQPVAV